MKKALSLLAALSVSSSALVAGVANIGYGSDAASGGAMFLNSTSVSLGYFTGDTFSADSTGWNSLHTQSTEFYGGWFYKSLASFDTAAADGSTAYLLFTDGSLNGFVTSASWDLFTGTVSPAAPSSLTYTIGGTATAASLTTLAGTGATVTVTNGGGTDFTAGGSSGTGVSFSLAAVPEPSAYGLIGGLFALGCVMLRRRV
jgi:hypothetical protein